MSWSTTTILVWNILKWYDQKQNHENVYSKWIISHYCGDIGRSLVLTVFRIEETYASPKWNIN